MTGPIFPNKYVLLSIAPENYKTTLRSIQKALRKEAWNLTAADLPALREAIRSLTSQTQDLRRRLTVSDRGEDPGMDGNHALLPVSPDETLLVPHYVSMEDFKRTAEQVVHKKRTEDSRLQKVLAELLRMCSPREDSDLILIEYYAQFFPAQDVLAATPASVIRSMFESIIAALKRLLKALRIGAPMVWDVLKNPDAAYLRFRGEMHELELRHPNYKWLEYVVLLPDLFRLYVRLMFDRDVAWTVKARVLCALAYLVCPLDFLPESLLGPIGYTEDVFLLAKAVLDMTNANQVAPGKLVEHWAGDRKVLARIMWVSQQFEEHLDFFRLIANWFQGIQRDASLVV